jgi:hypothetical protein
MVYEHVIWRCQELFKSTEFKIGNCLENITEKNSRTVASVINTMRAVGDRLMTDDRAIMMKHELGKTEKNSIHDR